MSAEAPQLEALRKAGHFFDIHREASLFEVAASLGSEVACIHAKRRFAAEHPSFPDWLHSVAIEAWASLQHEDVTGATLRTRLVEGLGGQPAALGALASEDITGGALVTAYALYRGDQIDLPMAAHPVDVNDAPPASKRLDFKSIILPLAPFVAGLVLGAILRSLMVTS